MDKQVLTKVLSKLHFSAQLPETLQERLAASAVVHRVAGGKVLFRENMQNDELMIIWTGKVALDMQVPGRGNIRILTLGPGEVVGWSALLGGGHMTTSATALEETQIVSFSAPALTAACDCNHSFGYFLMNKVASSLAGRLLDTRKQLLDLLTFEEAVRINPTPRK
jgi:CRP/FNR family transcriptional regulator, cyclic AMP receptor protein